MQDENVTEPTSEDLSTLDLEALRSFRNIAREEEDRVSYWRRLVQFRIDTLDKQKGVEEVPLRDLIKSLGATGTGARRKQLLTIAAHETMPELPELKEAWTAAVDPTDIEEVTRVRAALSEAEQRLSRYRTALHKRIDLATDELVERYRQDPALCLGLLDTFFGAESSGSSTPTL